MHFPKYWAKGTRDGLSVWRWSDSSVTDARAKAEEAVERLISRFKDGVLSKKHYAYADRPLMEPVVREVGVGSGDGKAVITRNRYGALVLNTDKVMFVDVDMPDEPISLGGMLKSLLGRKGTEWEQKHEAALLEKAEAWVNAHQGWGWRIYRTRAGFRLIATHDLFDPRSGETWAVFEALRADPLYRKLCETQKCFRARLTPKPWRCGMDKPGVTWPFEDGRAEAVFAKWEMEYAEKIGGKATCSLIRSIGSQWAHAVVSGVVDIHDSMTKATSGLPLA
jgi:hypothetical protein